MNWVEQIVTAILKFLRDVASTDKTSEDAMRDQDLRESLRGRIDDHERGVREPGDHGPSR